MKQMGWFVKVVTLFLVVMVTEGFTKGTCGKRHKRNILVHYTATNHIRQAGQLFGAHENVLVPPRTSAFRVMTTAAKCNPKMKFNYTEDPKYGAYITEINGVEANVTKKLFWAFLKRNSSGLCLHNVGVSSYMPKDGEKMIFRMARYSIFDKVPNCVTGLGKITMQQRMLQENVINHPYRKPSSVYKLP